jgi:hypothetical protein
MDRRRWSVRRSVVLLALLPLLALAGCHQGFGTAPHGAPATGAGQGTLTDIRTAAQPGFDRIVFDFTGPAPASSAKYVPASALIGNNDQRVIVNGHSFLQVRFSDALTSNSTPVRRTPSLAEVRDMRQLESFEAVVTYGVGLTAKNGFRIFTLTGPKPNRNRVVVDVQR